MDLSTRTATGKLRQPTGAATARLLRSHGLDRFLAEPIGDGVLVAFDSADPDHIVKSARAVDLIRDLGYTVTVNDEWPNIFDVAR